MINALKSKNSCGHDGLSTILLKAIKHDICKPITLIINQSLYTGIFPNKLKLAKVIPIYKKGDNTKLENYRPISILPAISKIFERAIFDQLSEHLKNKNVLYSSQYGFRKHHSTELAVLELIDRITQELDNSHVSINIYLDLSKAFDTLDHNILLYKLNCYGIRGPALNLFKSYLSNRQQYVEFRNYRSPYAPISIGVPQGSILGPLLFIIYVNDITAASDIFNCTMYADDTTLSTSINCSENYNNCDLINSELSKINEWLIVNKLSLNTSKTKYMLFHMPQKKYSLSAVNNS